MPDAENVFNEEIPVFSGELRKNDALFIDGAFEHEKPYIFTYKQKNCEIVHGPSCIIENEINTEACRDDGVPVLSRRSGGGTVVLSSGMCVIVIVGRRNKMYAQPIFDLIHSSLINLLCEAGIKGLQKRGISDIAMNDKKILGSSMYLGTRPDYYYYQSCLMVESDISLLSRYLLHPPREPDYRMKREHSEFCTTLKNEGYDTDTDSVAELIKRDLRPLLIKGNLSAG